MIHCDISTLNFQYQYTDYIETLCVDTSTHNSMVPFLSDSAKKCALSTYAVQTCVVDYSIVDYGELVITINNYVT